MSAGALQELGLSPLEGSQSQAAYTDFWTETYLPAIEKIVTPKPAVRERLERAAEFVTSVTETVIREHEIEALGDFPEFLSESPTYSNVIAAWDRTLGSLSTMGSGQGDLLRAAGILLEENINPQEGEFHWAAASNPRNIYKAFTSLVCQNDISAQRPNLRLLQAAELVHKAAWVDTDSQRQDRLLGVAAEMYSHVCTSPTMSCEDRWQAQNNLGDIEFHIQSARARRGKLKGDSSLHDNALQEMDDQIRRDAEALRQNYIDLPDDYDEAAQLVGHLFEDSVTLAARRTIISQDMPEIEVRHAFEHEDNSIRGLHPKTAFDIVVQRFEEAGITATPAQIKLRGSRKTNASRRRVYLPGIVYIESVGLPRETLIQAAADLAEGRDEHSPAVSQSVAQFRMHKRALGFMPLSA